MHIKNKQEIHEDKLAINDKLLSDINNHLLEQVSLEPKGSL